MKVTNFLWSLLVSTVVLFIAQGLGWIALDYGQLPVLLVATFWNQAAWLALLALIFTAVGTVLWLLYSVLWIGLGLGTTAVSKEAGCAVLGTGCLFLPVFYLITGFAKLYVAGQVLPGFEYTNVWWQVLILSIFVGVYAGSSSSSSKSSSD